ncbi:four helix bundle protein [Verrucomicrobiaceae bacterium 227]
MSTIQSFEDLEVWKRSSRLAVDVCVSLSSSRDYALKNQMERSSVSVPSNIAEGSERDSTADFTRFLRIAKGSCAELRTQLYILQATLKELGKPPLAKGDQMIAETKELAPMLQALINGLEANPKTRKKP